MGILGIRKVSKLKPEAKHSLIGFITKVGETTATAVSRIVHRYRSEDLGRRHLVAEHIPFYLCSN